MGTTLIQLDRRTDITTVIGAFRVYMTVHKSETVQDRTKEGGIETNKNGSEEKENNELVYEKMNKLYIYIYKDS